MVAGAVQSRWESSGRGRRRHKAAHGRFVLDLSEEIGERLQLAREQLELADRFDHVIVNDDLERAADEVEEIVRERIAATMNA